MKQFHYMTLYDHALAQEPLPQGSWNLQFGNGWKSQTMLKNKRPPGLNGHQSIRDFTLNFCQKGAYLHIYSPIIIINKNQQLYSKEAS